MWRSLLNTETRSQTQGTFRQSKNPPPLLSKWCKLPPRKSRKSFEDLQIYTRKSDFFSLFDHFWGPFFVQKGVLFAVGGRYLDTNLHIFHSKIAWLGLAPIFSVFFCEFRPAGCLALKRKMCIFRRKGCSTAKKNPFWSKKLMVKNLKKMKKKSDFLV